VEYRDEIQTCASCGSALRDGPAPPASAPVLVDDDTPVTIATFPNPHEAHAARIALESEGIEAFVQHDHGQYNIVGAWVQLQVAARDAARATAVLESGTSGDDTPADESSWS
jgi:hypothetical protein